MFSAAVSDARCVLREGEDLSVQVQEDSVFRLLEGRYLRHSVAYYRWVVRSRKEQLRNERNALLQKQLWDELAYAQMHLKQYKEAVEAIRAKGKLRYRDKLALANIFMASGQFEKAHRYYGAAFEMNPNGLFMSEGYGKHLLDYVANQRRGGRARVPVMILSERKEKSAGFVKYMEATSRQAGMGWGSRQWKAATNAVVQLILCGHRDSSIVWEVLGDLLVAAPAPFQRSRVALAGRAYLYASYRTESLWGRMEYRSLARVLLVPATKSSLRKFERNYGKGLRKGREFFKRIRTDEKRWIRLKQDVERRFTERYLRGRARP